MIPALTLDEARALFAAEVDEAWLAQLLATPDGVALLDGALAMLVEADRRDEADARSTLLASASRASKATAPVAVRRTRPGPPLRLPAGTRLSSPDGVVFLLDAPLTFREGEVGVEKAAGATAELVGHVGVFPAGSIDRFAPVLEGLSGEGVELDLFAQGGTRRVKLVTDASVPHPFRKAMVGLYVEITTDDGLHPSNLGKLVQIAVVNDSAIPTDPGGLEGAIAWSPAHASTAAEVQGFDDDAYPFEWVVRQWSELGLEVRSTADATLGLPPSLDELALDRNLPPFAGESTDALRARLERGPEPPTPLGLLRRVAGALVPFGQGTPELAVYEPRAPQPMPSEDAYAAQFPAFGGFIAGIHVAGMTTPETPDAMAQRRAGGVTLPGAVNPGLALLCDPGRPLALVRWLHEGATSEPTASAIRSALFRAIQAARAPGMRALFYRPTQHGYP